MTTMVIRQQSPQQKQIKLQVNHLYYAYRQQPTQIRLRSIVMLIGIVLASAIVMLKQGRLLDILHKQHHDELEIVDVMNSAPKPNNDYVQVTRKDYIMSNGWDTSPIVIEKYKLIFFSVPKVGCDTFKILFRRMMGYDDIEEEDIADLHHPQRNGLKYLRDYNISYATHIMNSPNYTKAIFLRDPKQRLLLTFIEKSIDEGYTFIQSKCCSKQNNIDADKCVERAKTLQGFVELTEWCMNEHWIPYTQRIDSKFHSKINFIGHIENIHYDSKRLLQQLGIWDQYGKTGWGKYENVTMFHHFSNQKQREIQRRIQFTQYYTYDLETIVEERYSDDYSNPIFNLTKKKFLKPKKIKDIITHIE